MTGQTNAVITYDWKPALKRLSEAVGVSGGESEVRTIILEALKDKCEQITIDAMGNVTALRRGTGASPLKVMLAAHMDETGFMITNVGDNGLISVANVGWHDLRYLPAQRVQVGNSKAPGAILWVPIHKSYGKNNLVEVGSLTIDIGADSSGGVPAKPGDRIAFLSEFGDLGKGFVRGKALDSRAGCVALLALLDSDPFPCDVYLTFTTQQAIGGRGARVAATRIKPDVALVLQGVDCNDMPTNPDKVEENRAPALQLGNGPALTLADPDMVSDRKIVTHLTATAKAKGIPYQINVQGMKRAFSEQYMIGQAGVAVAPIGIPLRFMQSPCAVMKSNDLDNTIRLVREFVATLPGAL